LTVAGPFSVSLANIRVSRATGNLRSKRVVRDTLKYRYYIFASYDLPLYRDTHRVVCGVISKRGIATRGRACSIIYIITTNSRHLFKIKIKK
jgi:hypothetical protein